MTLMAIKKIDFFSFGPIEMGLTGVDRPKCPDLKFEKKIKFN